MTNWTPMLSRGLAVLCAIAAAAPVVAQTQKDSLAGLIQAGNRKAALEKIRAGADVNEAQPDGSRPIHWAVYRVDHELVQALIAKRAKVDIANEFGSTPLAEAVKLADASMVKMLLDAGASPESPNQDGETALMLAAKTGELPLVDLLIKAGANVNVVEKFHGQTALMHAAAASKNAAEIVKVLLAKDANAKVRSVFTDWPSQISSEPRAQYRAVGGLTALLYASRNGCYACVEAFIAAGTDVNTPTPEGVTPLMMALDNEHNDVAKLLLEHGANPHLWDWWGRTALYIAVDRKAPAGGGRGGAGRGGPVVTRGPGPAPVSNMEIINALLAAEVDPQPQLNMHRPSRGGNSGRFGDNQLSTGATPLFRAAQSNDTEVMRALLAKGASPNINAMGFTPFLMAAGVGPGGARGGGGGTADTALLDLMIQHGADVNAQVTGTKTYSMRVTYRPITTSDGTSALHAAAQAGKTELVRYLLDKGANPQLVDSNGRKAIDLLSAAPAAGTPPAGAGRGGGGVANLAAQAEIRTLLQDAAAKRAPLLPAR
ncbi:MAG: ankyrin repeat domain-containing protein [Acidobacteriota bacterium]